LDLDPHLVALIVVPPILKPVSRSAGFAFFPVRLATSLSLHAHEFGNRLGFPAAATFHHRSHFGLVPIAPPSDPHASQDPQPNARIAASSKDIILVRPSSKLFGTAFCIPWRADGTQQCTLSRTTSPPLRPSCGPMYGFEFGALISSDCGIARRVPMFPQESW
jgi:hypothetical protein